MKTKTIEFLGMPRAGKTTQIGLLRPQLASAGLRVSVIAEREIMATLETPVTSPHFPLEVFIRQLELFLDAKSANKFDVIILDRGFGDLAAWADVRSELEGLPNEVRDAWRALSRTAASRYVDVTLHFSCPIDLCIARHQLMRHEPVDDFGLNRRVLEALLSSYEASRSKKDCDWLEIDGSKSILDVSADVRTFLYPVIFGPHN